MVATSCSAFSRMLSACSFALRSTSASGFSWLCMLFRRIEARRSAAFAPAFICIWRLGSSRSLSKSAKAPAKEPRRSTAESSGARGDPDSMSAAAGASAMASGISANVKPASSSASGISAMEEPAMESATDGSSATL